MDRKSLLKSAGAALLVLLLAGCATYGTKVSHERTGDLPASGSYAWLPVGSESPQPVSVTGDPELSAVVQREVDRVLANKGYSRQAGGTPGFWVGFAARIETRTAPAAGLGGVVESVARYAGSTYDPEERPVQWDEGTLTLDCAAGADRELCWRGTAKSKVSLSAPLSERHVHLAKAIEKVLEPFPHGSR
jgi:hypothetical protein